MIFGRIRLGEWRLRVEKTAKSAEMRSTDFRREIETNLNDSAYHERTGETPGIEGLSRVPGAAIRLRSGDFEAKSRKGVQAKVTVFLLPPDGVC